METNRNTDQLTVATAFRLGILMLVFAATGCQTSSPSQYISPRITGRVVDAQTQKPIAGVQVRRLAPEALDGVEVIKGGQILDRLPAVRTDGEGSFVLVSERNLALFQHLGWYSVSLAFSHPNYIPLSTEFTLANATNTPTGEPLVQAGDIRLELKPK